VLGEDYFSASLASAAKQRVSGTIELEKIVDHEAEIRQKQKSLENELGLSQEERYWIGLAKEFTYLKTLRKETVFQACCDSFSLLKEIAKRLNLAPNQVKFMNLRELRKALVEVGEINHEEIQARTKHCVVLFNNGIEFYSGEKAVELAAMIYEENVSSEVNEIKGAPAFPGIVSGVVKILRNAGDMKGFQAGNVLVSPATNPNLISAMKIAGAIVTDEGGITCHAAIVSRELKIPCVIGTKVATKWLKDGDKVEVDAVKGFVRKV
jgi:phosphohistidine swiveling domain-containing protein